MHKLIAAVAVFVALGPVSAFAQKVNTDFDPGFNFTNVKTYFWTKTTKITPNPLADSRIVESVDAWLKAAGWQRTEGQGDLALVPNFTTEKGQTLNTFYDTMGGGWGYRGWGGAGVGTATTTTSTFIEGTMIVDMFEASSKKLVWRGIATDTLSDKPQNNAKKIDKATEKMFKDKKKFPPKPKA